MTIKKLSKIEKELLQYHARKDEGFSTTGVSENIYLNALSSHHPNDVRKAIQSLESKGILKKHSDDSIRFTEDGLHKCRVHFKNYRWLEKIKKKSYSIFIYGVKNLIVPILVTILTTITLHYILGDPFDKQEDNKKVEKKMEK